MDVSARKADAIFRTTQGPLRAATVAVRTGSLPAYGRYGYRRITAMLRSAGWTVN